MLNEVRLLGHVGIDPELQEKNGYRIVNLSVATNKFWIDKSGEKKETTQWHRVTCFNTLADRAVKYIKKGSLIYVSAELQYHSYEKDGQKFYVTEIVATNIKFLNKKDKDSHTDNLENSDDVIPFDEYQS